MTWPGWTRTSCTAAATCLEGRAHTGQVIRDAGHAACTHGRGEACSVNAREGAIALPVRVTCKHNGIW